MLSGQVEIAQHTFLVQDGELMVFIPHGEGGSEPLSEELLKRLQIFLGFATIATRNRGR